MFFDVGGRKLYGVSFGRGSRTFLAHSGWSGTWEDWQPQFETLSADYKVVGYDHRGAGYTDASVEDITLEGLVDDIFGVMDNLQLEKCVLGGFSTGVRVALLAALKHPERFEGLVLMCGSNPTRPNRSAESSAGFAQMLKKNFDATLSQTILAFTPEPENTSHIRYWGYRLLKKNSPEQSARLVEVLNDATVTPEQLKSINLSTLLIYGTLDQVGPVADGEFLADQLPNSKLVAIEGGGHVCALTKPEQVTQAIADFLVTLS